MAEICYRRDCFPPMIIQHAVWLYLRVTLSYRDVEELPAQRGLDISYELTSATNWGWARLLFKSTNRRYRNPRRGSAARRATGSISKTRFHVFGRRRARRCKFGIGSHR
jgi:transposase-like protein